MKSRKVVTGLMVFLLLGAAGALGAVRASADYALEARQLVEQSKLTLESFTGDPYIEAIRGLIQQAKGIFIVPQMLRGAFVVGISGGSGVLLARGERTGAWSGPAFYTVGGASFGAQIGADASEVILLMMTERGITSFLSNTIKLGVDAGVAAGPVGAGASAASANLSADILSFSRSKGLYAGMSLDGAVAAVRPDWNDTYYGRRVSPMDILIRRTVSNSQAAPLIEAITKVAGGR